MPPRTRSSFGDRLTESVMRPLDAGVWQGADRARAAADEIEERLRGTRAAPCDPILLEAAVARLHAGAALTRRDVLHCASGLLTPVYVGGREMLLVESPQMVRSLLGQMKPLMARPRMGRRLAQTMTLALAHARRAPEGQGAQGAQLIGKNLVTWVSKSAPPPDPFFDAVRQARRFFAAADHSQFVRYVARGDEPSWQPLRALDVPSNAWVRLTSIRDGLEAVLSGGDPSVSGAMDRCVTLLEGHEDVLDEGLGMILRRWVQVRGQPEVRTLRDAAINRWGSPLADELRDEWRLRAGEPARKMVAAWLTRRAITFFFELAGGPGADRERLEFWSRYADDISSFCFYLSLPSQRRLRAARDEIGPLANDPQVCRQLNSQSVNAFLMTIGDYHFVEFSETGNALYVYESDQLPSGFGRRLPTVSDLKSRTKAVRWLAHHSGWQDKVRMEVGDLTGVRPPVAKRR